MKQCILACLCLVASQILNAQKISVKDAKDGELLPYTSLYCEAPYAYTNTNHQGVADISAFKYAIKIEIRAIGYEMKVFSYEDLKNNPVVELERSDLNMETLVIVDRWAQSTRTTPYEVVKITAEQVELQNPQTAADLLTISGKVYVQKSQQGGGSPMIRGFATNRLLYSVDGVRMNTAIFRGGNIQNVISLDPFAIEDAEVVFGPGSVAFGSDAIGGVMSFQTLTPELSLSDDILVTGKANVRYSSANNEKTGHFDVNVGGEKLAMLSSFSSFNFDDLRQGSHGLDDYLMNYYVSRIDSVDVVNTNDDPRVQRPSAYDQMNFMQKIRFKPNHKWDIQYGFHLSETSPYGRYDRHQRFRNDLPRYAVWNYGPQKWSMNNLNVTHIGGNKMYDDMSIRLAYQTFEESRIDRSLNSLSLNETIENVAASSANIDFIKRVKLRHLLSYGAEYVHNDVVSKGFETDISTNETVLGQSRYPQATWSAMGVFLKDKITVTENFTVHAGVRFNQFSLNADFDTTFYPFPFTEANLNNQAITGSLGLVYTLGENWIFSSNLGTAYRSPNVDDIGKVFDSEPGAVTIPNPNLEAEYSYNADLSIAGKITDHLKLDVTAYYTILENALVRRNFTLNGMDSIIYDGALSQVQALQNAARATVYGLQAGIDVEFGGGFSLKSDINIQIGEEELDDGTTSPSRHAAPTFGVTRINYKKGKLNWQVYAMYQAYRSFEDLPIDERGKTEIYALDGAGRPFVPSWYTINLKSMYKVNENFTVSAGLENITDQRYRPYSSGISGAGRNFIMALNVKF